MSSLPDRAALVALHASADPVAAFRDMGGSIRFTCGTNYARLGSVAASCTVSERDAVLAWLRAAERKAVTP